MPVFCLAVPLFMMPQNSDRQVVFRLGPVVQASRLGSVAGAGQWGDKRVRVERGGHCPISQPTGQQIGWLPSASPHPVPVVGSSPISAPRCPVALMQQPGSARPDPNLAEASSPLDPTGHPDLNAWSCSAFTNVPTCVKPDSASSRRQRADADRPPPWPTSRPPGSTTTTTCFL